MYRESIAGLSMLVGTVYVPKIYTLSHVGIGQSYTDIKVYLHQLTPPMVSLAKR